MNLLVENRLARREAPLQLAVPAYRRSGGRGPISIDFAPYRP